MKNKLLTKADIVLAAVLLIIGIGSPFLLKEGSQPALVEISVDGQKFGVYDLKKDAQIDVLGLNSVVIENGKVYVKEATCRGHDCMDMGKISECGQMIVCLPNKVIITVKGDDGGIDAEI